MTQGIALSAAMAGVESAEAMPPAEMLRSAMTRARAAGCAAVQLDGRAAGMRARELDRSARRDIAATLRRGGLACSGVDLWIPAEHFASTVHRDRALGAATGAIELAGEMEGLFREAQAKASVALTLPRPLDGEVRRAIVDAAERAGVMVADYSWKREEACEEGSPLGPGIDPAMVLLAGGEPIGLAAAFGRSLAGARWSDASTSARVTPGAKGGRLDVEAYGAVLVTVGFRGYAVVDAGDPRR